MSMHDYSKQFNHLTQYASDQVDIDEKKDRFMIGLSTKLQERMALNTGGTFPEFVSNVMIGDDAIHAHKKTTKRKDVAAPSGSAPLKYRTVCHHGSTYPPRQPQQYQHQHQPQQWAPRLPQRQHQWAAPKALPPPPSVMCLFAPLTLGPPLATPASTVVHLPAPRRRRMPLKAMSLTRHVVRRRWPLQRPAVSTTPPWKMFSRVSKSSRVRFL
jgi:hypothetical protein